MKAATETTRASRRDAAVTFLQLVSTGKVRDAFERYVSPQFRHHNVYFPGDAKSLATAMQENADQNPRKNLEVLHTLEDGPLVAVHSRVQMKPGAPTYALAHIFRFEGVQIAELWDLSMEVPKDSPNQYGAF
jgi:predicted SnoaL-like aldol condensation-catalyzing enzyme